MDYNQHKGTFLLISASFFFSFIGVLTRLSGADSITVVFWRALIAVALFAGVLLYRHRSWSFLTPIRKWRRHLFVYGLCISITLITFTAAFLFTTMTNTVIIHYLAPILVLAGSKKIVKEHVDSCSILSALLGMIGVIVIVGRDFIVLGKGTALLGDILSLISAFSYAGMLLLTRKARQVGIPIDYFVFWGWAIALFFASPFMWAIGNTAITSRLLLTTFLLALFCTLLPFYLANYGMKFLSAKAASVCTFSEVIFVAINAVIFFHEPLNWTTVSGAILIASAILIALAGKEKIKKSCALSATSGQKSPKIYMIK